MRGPTAIGAAFAGVIVVTAHPAMAQSDPMLAGAAFSSSDLSPIKGVTALQFIPGHGLKRYSLDQIPAAGDPPVQTASPAEPAPVAQTPDSNAPLAVTGASGKPPPSLIARARAALAPAAVALTQPRWYVFVSAGGHALGYSFVHSSMSGWSNSGASVEQALMQSKAQIGLAWESDANAALFSVMQTKEQFLATGLPADTENRVAITLMHHVN